MKKSAFIYIYTFIKVCYSIYIYKSLLLQIDKEIDSDKLRPNNRWPHKVIALSHNLSQGRHSWPGG